ncbi:site-specific tyrosine recombinase XerD [Glutamicibacter endophyticus]|uniref:site-specific tyrosine recombinase XerD n=1 Tax=Glutamicibacter sp. PS TaxID=3075634 RepID=UPI0037BEF1D9
MTPTPSEPASEGSAFAARTSWRLEDLPTDHASALREYLQHVGIERGLAANTLASYRRDLVRYLGALTERGIRTPGGITPEAVTGYLQQLARGTAEQPALSARSVARHTVALRQLHKFWELEGTCLPNPAREVQPPAYPQALPKAIDIDQVTALLEAVTGDTPAALRDRAIVELLYSTGARITELIELDVDDLHLAERDVVRLTGKGSKQRLVPVGSYARTALDEYLVRARPGLVAKGKGTPALFVNQRGGRLSRQSVWLLLNKAAKQAELGVEISPHTLRHSFATHLLQGGADVRVVQELLGHASVTTTQLYTKVTIATLRDAYLQAHPRAR